MPGLERRPSGRGTLVARPPPPRPKLGCDRARCDVRSTVARDRPSGARDRACLRFADTNDNFGQVGDRADGVGAASPLLAGSSGPSPGIDRAAPSTSLDGRRAAPRPRPSRARPARRRAARWGGCGVARAARSEPIVPPLNRPTTSRVPMGGRLNVHRVQSVNVGVVSSRGTRAFQRLFGCERRRPFSTGPVRDAAYRRRRRRSRRTDGRGPRFGVVLRALRDGRSCAAGFSLRAAR